MFQCVLNSAWADGNLADAAEQLDNMVERPNQSQPNPGPRGDGTPCIFNDLQYCLVNFLFRRLNTMHCLIMETLS